ncbi:hypothetical protein [Polycladidibacter hongkongensis]|uniref:hypothetical protein n=1 Tax=Polycladidibacter hongkongensis TaxID=1647556 RepID=UPI00082DFDA4|nr:hypothetical protein [Pseudovibrio hongkongensis]
MSRPPLAPKDRRVRVVTYLLPEVHKDLLRRKKRLKRSVSSIIEQALQNGELPNENQLLSVKGMLQVNADLARLGNLFNDALSRADMRANHEAIASLIDDISQIKNQLKETVLEIKR